MPRRTVLSAGSQSGFHPSDVNRAYSERTAEHVHTLGRIEHAREEDRVFMHAWASTIEGADPVSAFIESARSAYPDSSYRLGSAGELGVEGRCLSGILAWYSLIHTAPERIDACFEEFARSLRPGGTSLIGYFDGAAGEAFEHAVVTAYYWSAQALSGRLRSAGFDVVEVVSRKAPGARPHGALIAQRAD